VPTPDDDTPPILADKHHAAPSVFTPESLLREARRQKGAVLQPVPDVCVLDPDGDIVRRLRAKGRSRRHDGWVCYHTELDVFTLDGREVGVVGCAVGAAFAVLVAEELFASGCRLLLSVTSAGQLVDLGPPPYFVAIDRALRDEGTSYHYLPSAATAAAPAHLLEGVDGAFDDLPEPILRGGSWTTDAPFRETEAAIAAARERGLLAVEMEAAALYAFAEARGRAVLCFAHVTNQMGQIDGDFEKGAADGVEDALALVARAVARLAPAG
jgi:uridine phosphorylase